MAVLRMPGAASFLRMPRWFAFAVVLGLVSTVRGEEEKKDPVAIAISVMLMGSIGFQMLMFYLVNWNDKDIQRYSWKVISQTISIFCAVLLFQAFNGIVEEKLIEGSSPIVEVTIDMLQMLFWLFCMQIVLAVTSGAVHDLIGGKEPDLEEVELQVKSWSVLFSHIAGFAAINAWGSWQQKFFNSSPMHVVLVVPIACTGLFAIYHAFDKVREKIAHMDDGEEDEFEKKWDEETEEAENDVAGLSLSFLTVQAIRFAISGILPNQEGLEIWEDAISHTPGQCHALLACGVGFFLVSVIVLKLEPILKKEEECEEHGHAEASEKIERILEIVNNYVTFGLAWCLFYGVRWAMSHMHFTNENALLMVTIALFLSAASFLFIFILDKVEDNHLLGQDSEVAEAAVEKIITGLGILIGFSWEQSFDTAVDVVAEGLADTWPPSLSKLVMSACLVLIVFPAWRYYILPTEVELEEATTEKGAEVARLKEFGKQHFDLFLQHHTSDADLDRAHLKMKHIRRETHGISHTQKVPPGLKHLRVSASCIEEVDAPDEHLKKAKKKRQTHVNDPTERLLG
eukprot:TRINITY_DN36651_c0_g1_i1.p1 TRINITY_DN36651_c0_g1~~TRINITY_DN36651_c0_g1_i1.p1  ORF type:complete len:570 (-),score=136.83 TRINITY_DN36651_c0_g1_i1:65-1774(-)